MVGLCFARLTARELVPPSRLQTVLAVQKQTILDQLFGATSQIFRSETTYDEKPHTPYWFLDVKISNSLPENFPRLYQRAFN